MYLAASAVSADYLPNQLSACILFISLSVMYVLTSLWPPWVAPAPRTTSSEPASVTLHPTSQALCSGCLRAGCWLEPHSCINRLTAACKQSWRESPRARFLKEITERQVVTWVLCHRHYRCLLDSVPCLCTPSLSPKGTTC